MTLVICKVIDSLTEPTRNTILSAYDMSYIVHIERWKKREFIADDRGRESRPDPTTSEQTKGRRRE